MGWLVPVLVTLVAAIVVDRMLGAPRATTGASGS